MYLVGGIWWFPKKTEAGFGSFNLLVYHAKG